MSPHIPTVSKIGDAGNAEFVTNNNKDRKEILFNGHYYDVTDWIPRHPGGNVIKYYTEKGEDATQAINQFHFRSADKVSGIMSSLKKRPATQEEGAYRIHFHPSIHFAHFHGQMDRRKEKTLFIGQKTMDFYAMRRHRELSRDFNKLHEEFVAEGLFNPSIPHLILRFFDVLLLGIIGYQLFWSDQFHFKICGIFLLGLCQGRLGWIQHEGGHNSLTGDPKIDKAIQAAAFGLGGGLSGAWWNSQHNKHHAMPQRLNHDVDLETMPFVAYNVKVVRNPQQGKNVFIKYQAILYFTLDIFLLAFWWRLYVHPRCAINKKAYTEFIWVAINVMWAFHLGYWYFLVAYLSSVYLLGNFVLNHSHLPVATKPTHWVEYCLEHTANIQPSFFMDYWMGYLNYQIEHHLFPTMPQFRNRLIASRVKALARRHNIHYKSYSYSYAVAKTVKNLGDVARTLQKQ